MPILTVALSVSVIGTQGLRAQSTFVNHPPTAQITRPTGGARLGMPAAIVLAADATDADGTISSVAFYVNGSLAGIDTTSPYRMSWLTWTAGTYQVVAVATDNLGATSKSAIVNFTVSAGIASACKAPDPFAAIGGGLCVSSTWLPPGYSPPPGALPLEPARSAASDGCVTVDPYSELGGGTCIRGGWLPPGVDAPRAKRTDRFDAGCMSGDPFAELKDLVGVCIRGTWVPAIAGKHAR